MLSKIRNRLSKLFGVAFEKLIRLIRGRFIDRFRVVLSSLQIFSFHFSRVLPYTHLMSFLNAIPFLLFSKKGAENMLYIDDKGVIRLTRGDTARLNIPIKNDLDNSEYVVQSDDILYFTVKKSTRDSEPLFQKSVKGSNTIHIKPEDTSKLSFGKYKYDVELNMSSGDVYTVIEPTIFEIMEEVT